MSRFFIDRPIVAIVIAILTVIGGLVMLQRLPIAQYPDIVPPIIQIKTTYTGADALAVEKSVATPIEQQVNGVQGMIYMKSINGSDGTMTLQVSFEVGTDVNLDQVFAQNRLAQANSQLPTSVVEYGTTVQQTVGLPLLVIPIYSPDGSFDAEFLGNYATINVIDDLARVSGVGQVQLFGAAQYAMRVWVRPDTLAKLQITVTEVINAIKAQNVVNPAGQVGAEPAPPGQEFTYNVTAQGRLIEAEQFGNIIVRANPDGSIVRLSDVARIELGAQTYMQIGRYQGKPAAVVAVYQSPGSNALQTAGVVKTQMEKLAKRFPNDLQYAIALDTTLPVSEGITEIVHTIFEAMVLVIIVVFLFLQGWRATLIPLIAVPVSLIGAFLVFPVLGFSINTLSLLGLVLAIGLVVDDAIVVVEAVEVGIEHGLSPRDATIKAMDEVSSPVIGIALILAAVFIPTVFMTGITGLLYQQFAVTIAVSVLLSAFNALTLSPALSALLLRPKQPARGPLGRFFAAFNRFFDRMTAGYVNISRSAIKRAARSMILLAGLTVIGVGIGRILPTSFIPEEDQGFFFMQLQLPDAASLQRTDAFARKVEAILAETEGIQSYATIAGFSLLSNISQSYAGFYFVQLDPWAERGDRTAEVIMRDLNLRLHGMPEGMAFAFGPPSIPGVGNSGGFDIMLQDRSGSDGVEYLAANAKRLIEAAMQRPELTGVVTVFRPDVPQIYADVNIDKVYKLGVDSTEVYQTLQALLGSTYVNQFNRFGRIWKVFLQAEPEFRVQAEDIGGFYVRNKDQQMVPLSTLVNAEPSVGPAFTNRYNLFRSIEVLGSPAPGYSSGQAMAAVEEVAKQVLPADITFEWTNMSYQEANAGGAGAIFALSLVFVFLILAGLYESWSLPWSVLLTTPVAIFGAFLGIWGRGLDNDVFSQIGLVMLIGLVAKNAILIVEFAKAELEAGGKTVVDAALAGAKSRLRPILMTSFAFILGCVPLWIATGSGAISRQSIGTTVITGMLAATGIAIFIVPVLFVLVERFARRRPRGRTRDAARRAAAGAEARGSHLMRASRSIAALLTVAFATSCAVGPNFVRPPVTAPEDYRGQVEPAEATSIADLPWWEVFDDEVLQQLIRDALASNYDLKIAVERVEQARAFAGVARSPFFPSIGYEGSGGRTGQPPLLSTPRYTTDLFYGAFTLAWEIDVWGRIRRSSEAAREALYATEEFRRGVLLSLVTGVAGAYLTLLELDRELVIARDTVESFQETLDLFTRRFEGGVGNKLQVARAQAALSETEAQVPDLERRIVFQENLISVLLGRNPGPIARGVPFEERPLPAPTPPGLPSALLERRPDVLQAEHTIASANAEVGVAIANFFPKIGLTALYGGQSTELSDIVKSNFSIWNVAGNAAGPLFQGFELIERYRAQKASWRESIASYEQTVITAFSEVSNTLTAQTKLGEVRAALEVTVDSYQESVRLARIRYDSGLASYYEVLEAQQLLFPAEISLAQAQLDQWLTIVTLYRALGGGWQLPDEEWNQTQTAPP